MTIDNGKIVHLQKNNTSVPKSDLVNALKVLVGLGRGGVNTQDIDKESSLQALLIHLGFDSGVGF